MTASSYSLPTKYGGDVTTSATELAGNTSEISRLSRLWIAPTDAGIGLTVSSVVMSGGVNRA